MKTFDQLIPGDTIFFSDLEGVSSHEICEFTRDSNTIVFLQFTQTFMSGSKGEIVTVRKEDFKKTCLIQVNKTFSTSEEKAMQNHKSLIKLAIDRENAESTSEKLQKRLNSIS